MSEVMNASNMTRVRLDPSFAYLMLAVVPIATIFGNCLVVVSVLTQRHLKSSTNYLLLSLATADLLIGIMVMPMSIYSMIMSHQWDVGAHICSAYLVADVSLSTASILHLMTISIDRFYAVARYLEYRRPDYKSRLYVQIVVCWLCSLGLGLPVGMVLQTATPTDQPWLNCGIQNAWFMLYGSLFSFILPSLVMLAMYSVVFYKLAQQLRAVRCQEIAASKMVNFGENLNQLIADAHRASQSDMHTRMMALAMPFINEDHEPEGDSLSVSSEDLQELKNIMHELYQPTSKSKDVGSSSTEKIRAGDGVNEGGQFQKFSRSIKTRISIVSQPCDLSPSRSQTTKRNSKALPATQRLTRVKHRAMELIMKMRSTRGNAVRKEARATKLVAMVLVVFLFCWTPFFVVNLMHSHHLFTGMPHDPVLDSAFTLTSWLGSLNSCLNPVIYAMINKRFRTAFGRILHCRELRAFFRRSAKKVPTRHGNGVARSVPIQRATKMPAKLAVLVEGVNLERTAVYSTAPTSKLGAPTLDLRSDSEFLRSIPAHVLTFEKACMASKSGRSASLIDENNPKNDDLSVSLSDSDEKGYVHRFSLVKPSEHDVLL